MDKTQMLVLLERTADFTDNNSLNSGSEKDANGLRQKLADVGLHHTEKFTTQYDNEPWTSVKFNYKGWKITLGPNFEAIHLQTGEQVTLEFTD